MLPVHVFLFLCFNSRIWKELARWCNSAVGPAYERENGYGAKGVIRDQWKDEGYLTTWWNRLFAEVLEKMLCKIIPLCFGCQKS